MEFRVILGKGGNSEKLLKETAGAACNVDAGVVEHGRWTRAGEGAVQGA